MSLISILSGVISVICGTIFLVIGKTTEWALYITLSQIFFCVFLFSVLKLCIKFVQEMFY